jgi:predicted RNA-binding Zn ribbon-like protein
MHNEKLGLNPDLGSGHPALEFTNTVSDHAGPAPREKLIEYAHLLGWARRVGLLDPAQARTLTRRAARRPDEAAAVLARSVELREAMYRILVALTKGKSPPDSDLAILNNVLQQVTDGAHITRHLGTFAWEWNLNENALDLPLRLAALSGVDLLTSAHLQRLGQCADEDGCGWLFVDTSKNRSRRWCDINDCGNRAKQRRYQKRARLNP